MIRYTIEETTTNTCPPCPPCPTNPRGPAGRREEDVHPALAFIGGSIALVVMYQVLKFILIGITGR